MKILFLDHSYHKQTKSNEWILDILTQLGDVEIRWDDSWNPQSKNPVKLDDVLSFDLVVVWQVWATAILCARKGVKNMVVGLMFDSMWGDCDVHELLPHKMLCPCEQLYNDLQVQGFNNLFYTRYMPKPSEKPITDFSTIRPFLWQRRNIPSWQTATQLLQKTPYEALTLKMNPDPGSSIQPPTAIDCENHRIKMINGWLPEYEFNALLDSQNLYFSPRTAEGVGFSFLDAMARGIPVIGYDQATMNEYIISGYSGHLYSNPQPIEGLTTAGLKKWSQNTLTIVEAGYEQWLNDIERLKLWLV